MRYFKSKDLKDIKLLMINLSFLWVIFFSLFRIVTISIIAKTSNSIQFINSVKTLPQNPQLLLILSIIYCFLLLIFIGFENFLPLTNMSYLLYSVAETIIGLLLLEITGYSNSSILLLIAANLLIIPAKNEIKSFVMAVLILLYILCLSSIPLNVTNSIPMSNFLVVYNDKTTEIILFIKTLVTTTTNILFIIYAILFFMIEEQEMNRITALNQQLDNANAQLKEANIKLKDYSRTVENMSKAQERNRLAKEIHDTLGHALTNIVAGIDASLILIEGSVPETKEQLSLTRDIASHGIIDIRRSVKALRPDALEQASTRIAINNMLNKIQSTTKVKIINKNELSESSFDRDEEEAIYRTVQESITNAIRHGGASTIRVSIKEESNIVHIIIQDNGCGCESIKEGFGLLHMKERISMLNGKIEYSGTNGFLVDAYIPLRKREI